MKKKKWKMPEWMEPYRFFITTAASGWSIEDLMNSEWSQAKSEVGAKIEILTELREKNLLREIYVPKKSVDYTKIKAPKLKDSIEWVKWYRANHPSISLWDAHRLLQKKRGEK